MSWADRAAPVVSEVIRRVGRSDLKVLRQELRKAYPFGRRANSPRRDPDDPQKELFDYDRP